MLAPTFDLDPPGTLAFGARLAFEGHALNAFALTLRIAANRADFLHDETAYMTRLGVAPELQRSVLERDWTALLLAGGHLQAMLKVAATVGQSLWHIGAHNAGVDVNELRAAVPRRVAGLPATAEAAVAAETSRSRRT